MGFSQHPQPNSFDWWYLGEHQWMGRRGRKLRKSLLTKISQHLENEDLFPFPSLLVGCTCPPLSGQSRSPLLLFRRLSGAAPIQCRNWAISALVLVNNSLTKDVSKGLKLHTDFTWISTLESVLKNDGIMFTGWNRKSDLHSYLPCPLLV